MTTRPSASHPASHALRRDLFATGAARLRRRLRLRQAGLGSIGVVSAVLVFALLTRSPEGTSPPASQASTPLPASAAVESPPPSFHKRAAYHAVESDEELLDLLRGQGPVLVTLPDGRRQLILTRPADGNHY